MSEDDTMSTYVIIGTDPDGYVRYGWRNVSESQREDALEYFRAHGWTHVVAQRETF